VLKILLAIVLFIFASQGIVSSASYFAETFHWPILLIGLFIVGLAIAFPKSSLLSTRLKKTPGWFWET